MKTTRWMRLLAVLFSLALIAAACGDDDDSGDAGNDDDSSDSGDGGENAGNPPPEAPGFDGETIRLGVISPLSGPVAVIGEPLTNGNRVFFDALNAEGGVAGQYPVELVEFDSQYAAATGVQGYNDMKDDVTLFAQVLGTAVTNAVLEQLRADDIMAAPASLDSLWIREANLIPVGAPYQVQVINGFDWYFSEGGGDVESDVVCALAADDPYGEAGIAGLEFAAENVGFEVAEVQRFVPTDTDFSAQIGALGEAGCTVSALVATPSITGAAMGAAAQTPALAQTQWLGTSPVWVTALAQSPVAPYLQANFTVLSDAPEWGDESVEGMGPMLAAVEEFDAEQAPDGYFMFGYYQAQAVTAILEQAVANGDLSREGILAASEQVGTVSFGGLTGDYTYGPVDERQPPLNTNIAKVDPESPTGLVNETEWVADFVGDFEL